MQRRVVMSLDRSMASDYRGTAYFGFTACFPRRFLPESLYYRLVAPEAPDGADGGIGLADCGSRKIEAALRREGFDGDDFIFAHPDRLDDVIGPETRVFMFGSHDPLGRGPLTSMFTRLMGRGMEAYNAAAVERMLNNRSLRKHRPVVIAGGAGAWELAVDEQARRRLGVDCVVVGEGERAVPALVRKALDGQTLPEVVHGPTVPVDEIPEIQGPTVNGVIEISRGCGRGCSFCVPNLQSLRSLPVEQIVSEARRAAAGNRGRVVLHSEDLFRYRALPHFEVNHDAICELFEQVSAAPGVHRVGSSHGTITGALSAPDTLSEIAKILRVGAPGGPRGFGFQAGIETGSRRLAKRWLAAKMQPYAPDDWPEAVLAGADLMHRLGFFSAFTLVFGLPGETEEDVRDTLALVRGLSKYSSLIVPLFYVPMGISRKGRDGKPFTFEDMTPTHFALLQACWEHNYSHLGRIWEQYGHDERSVQKRVVHGMIGGMTWYLRGRMRRFVRRQGALDPNRVEPVAAASMPRRDPRLELSRARAAASRGPA